MKATEFAQVEAITIDDTVSATAMRAFAGSVVAGAIFWAVALAAVLY